MFYNYFVNLGYTIEDMGHIESDNPNSAYMVSSIVHSRVGVIQVKWGRGEIWIHIRIEKNFVVKIHFIIYKKQTNKQTNKEKEKEKENKPMLGLT